jgi:hypothetical protein
MTTKLYEWVVIYEGTKNKDGDWKERPEVLTSDRTLADTPEQVQILAARSIPETHLEHLDRVTIAVRPF